MLFLIELGPWRPLAHRCWGRRRYQFLLFMTRMRASDRCDVIDYVYVVIYSCLVPTSIRWRDRAGCHCSALAPRLQEKPHPVHIISRAILG